MSNRKPDLAGAIDDDPWKPAPMEGSRAGQCTATSQRSGQRCRRYAVLGATVCRHHGGAAPQVKAAAARRVTLAEAMAAGERRHPLEVLADALHGVDVLAQQTQKQLTEGELDAGLVQALLDSLKTQAAMAKLVLDAGAGRDQWSAREAMRRQGEAVAEVVRETLRGLGIDPADSRAVAAFQAAVQAVAGVGPGGRKPKVIEGSVE